MVEGLWFRAQGLGVRVSAFRTIECSLCSCLIEILAIQTLLDDLFES